jgi:hypothetical protein
MDDWINCQEIILSLYNQELDEHLSIYSNYL